MSFFSSIRGFRPKKSKNGQAKFDSNPTSPIMPTSDMASNLSVSSRISEDPRPSTSTQTLKTSSSNSRINQPQHNSNKPSQPQQQASQQPSIQHQQGSQIGSQQVGQQQQQQQQITSQQASQGAQQMAQPVNSGVEPPLFLCQPFVRTTLVKGSFKTIVQLPKYVDLNEWLALNVFEMLTNLNQFFSLVKDFIPPDSVMTAGPNVTYTYYDPQSNKSYNLPAGQYIELALNAINSKVNDQASFPTKNGNPFPPNFLRDVKSICIQMFRIFAYIYYNQFDKIIHLSLEPHWNSFFAHFISFVKEFNLMDEMDLQPMSALIISFEQQGHIITSAR